MKRFLGIVVLGFVFVLTTGGLFTSALEECADIYMEKDWRFVQTSEKERVDVNPQESKKQKKIKRNCNKRL